MENQLLPPEYLVLNSESGFAYIFATGSLTDGNIEPGSRNMSFLTDFSFRKGSYSLKT